VLINYFRAREGTRGKSLLRQKLYISLISAGIIVFTVCVLLCACQLVGQDGDTPWPGPGYVTMQFVSMP